MDALFDTALTFGFSAVASVEPKKLTVQSAVRAMCAANRCHAYHRNWTCPPECGTLEQCAAAISSCTAGVLLQTTGYLEDSFDYEGMMALEKQHLSRFHAFCEQIRKKYPNALCLGSGGCRICKVCAYPDLCRFPEKACSSMEAYGLLVSDVCKLCGIPYYYGENTLSYTACVLLPNTL